jgi:hypothetical protein
VRFAIPIFFTLTIALSTGCAAVLGLDSGNDVADVADAEAGTEPSNQDAETDAAITPPVKDSGTPLTCAPGTANCDGNAANGCETMTNTPQHCGSCTTMCTPMQSCTASSHCCTNDNMLCENDTDCCSGKCNGHNCGH